MAGRVGLPERAYSDPARARQTFETIINNLEALPGIASAAVVSRAPLMGGGGSNGLLAEGKPFDPSNLIDARLPAVAEDFPGGRQNSLPRWWHDARLDKTSRIV